MTHCEYNVEHDATNCADGRGGFAVSAADKTPVINAAEHAWVIHERRFAPDAELATCPTSLPNYEYSGEFLMFMKTYRVDGVVISHVCYYGRDNSYTSHCIKRFPGKFAGIGSLVGYRLHPPDDEENPGRLERLIREDGLIGLRLSSDMTESGIAYDRISTRCGRTRKNSEPCSISSSLLTR